MPLFGTALHEVGCKTLPALSLTEATSKPTPCMQSVSEGRLTCSPTLIELENVSVGGSRVSRGS